MNLSGGKSDPELTRVVVEGSQKARDWLTELGVPWTRRSRDPAASDQAEGQGKALAAVMRSAVERKGIKICHQTQGLSLIRKGESVVGIRARNNDGLIELNSRRCVGDGRIPSESRNGCSLSRRRGSQSRAARFSVQHG